MSERFRAAARDVMRPDSGSTDLLPSRLAAVCQQVLAVDGAGLSLFSDDFRLPLGASSDEATRAEQLQFTAMEGPCWDAVRGDLPLAADAAVIAARWPQFAQDLHRVTSYRSVASVPLRLARSAGGAVDLYFTGVTGAGDFDIGDATAVAGHIADILNAASDTDDGGRRGVDAIAGPRWAKGPAARSRNGVWIAVGLLLGHERIATVADALALLRAVAYSEGGTVDGLAADLVEGRRSAEDLTGPPAD